MPLRPPSRWACERRLRGKGWRTARNTIAPRGALGACAKAMLAAPESMSGQGGPGSRPGAQHRSPEKTPRSFARGRTKTRPVRPSLAGPLGASPPTGDTPRSTTFSCRWGTRPKRQGHGSGDRGNRAWARLGTGPWSPRALVVGRPERSRQMRRTIQSVGLVGDLRVLAWPLARSRCARQRPLLSLALRTALRPPGAPNHVVERGLARQNGRLDRDVQRPGAPIRKKPRAPVRAVRLRAQTAAGTARGCSGRSLPAAPPGSRRRSRAAPAVRELADR